MHNTNVIFLYTFSKNTFQNFTCSFKYNMSSYIHLERTINSLSVSSHEERPELTTHAVCTASDTLPALGSHQNT